MKIKKFFVFCFSVFSAAALLAGCAGPAPSQAAGEEAPPETYEGTVSEGYDGGSVLTLETDTGESYSFSLGQETKITGADAVAAGDRVTLTCVNKAGAAYPSVLAIEVMEPQKEPIRMLMIEGALYTDTGRTNNLSRCGVMDGEIVTSVAADEVPTQNNESNFGTGYGYQFSSENGVDVCIDGVWSEFAKEPLS